MVLIRLIYAADLPDPHDFLKKLESGELGATIAASQNQTTEGSSEGRTLMQHAGSAAQAALKPVPQSKTEEQPDRFADINDLYTYLRTREVLLANELYEFAQPVAFRKGHIEVFLKDGARPDLYKRLSKALKEHTGHTFMVSPAKAADSPSLADIEQAKKQDDLQAAAQHPDIQKILNAFPGAKVTKIVYNEEDL